eukprot:1742576-Rhodomonas_salina.1
MENELCCSSLLFQAVDSSSTGTATTHAYTIMVLSYALRGRLVKSSLCSSPVIIIGVMGCGLVLIIASVPDLAIG